MDQLTKHYRESELNSITDFDHSPTIKIIGKDGATKWLSISEKEYLAIKSLLTN
jgi:hypothetical protein